MSTEGEVAFHKFLLCDPFFELGEVEFTPFSTHTPPITITSTMSATSIEDNELPKAILTRIMKQVVKWIGHLQHMPEDSLISFRPTDLAHSLLRSSNENPFSCQITLISRATPSWP